eukprot:750553-Hanusia_phi.AAC.1
MRRVRVRGEEEGWEEEEAVCMIRACMFEEIVVEFASLWHLELLILSKYIFPVVSRAIAGQACRQVVASSSAQAVKSFPSFAAKRFATGPAASPTTVSDELLEKLSKLSTQVSKGGERRSRADAHAGPHRWALGYGMAIKLHRGSQVLVMSSVGPWESVGGDIKFLRLKQRNVSCAPRLRPLECGPPHCTHSRPSQARRSDRTGGRPTEALTLRHAGTSGQYFCHSPPPPPGASRANDSTTASEQPGGPVNSAPGSPRSPDHQE